MKEQGKKIRILPRLVPGSLETVMPLIKMEGWEERAVLEADRMNYNSLCKLPFGYANEWGCRKDARNYNNHHLLLNMDYMPDAV